jgi:outer membrane protein OmpA-like peptidoglycan-associated protein
MVRIVLTYLLILFLGVAVAQEARVAVFETQLKGDVYSPSFYKESLIVCSNQKDRFIKTVLDNQHTEPADIYVLDANGNYERFDETFRTNYNDGPASFNKEANFLVISRNVKVDQKLGLFQSTTNKLGIYESKKDYYGWTQPKLLPFVDTAYHYTHPALNKAGDKLVFSSNMPGGHGGFDIWISYKEGDSWSTPENAGREVNTASNELFPSLEEGFIYFSSDRKGIGALDIYAFNERSSVLELLPEPINSAADDFGLIAKDKLRNGYFSSNRNGQDELFSFEFDRPDFEDCDSLVPNNLCFTLYEENAHELGEVGALIYEWHINDVVKRGISIDYCFPGPGDYEITLDIIDTIVNKTYFNQSYYYLSLQLEEQPFITTPDTVIIGNEIELSAEETNLPGVEISEYLWSVDNSNSFGGLKSKYTFNELGTHQLQLGVKGKKGGQEFQDCVYKSIVCVNQMNSTGSSKMKDALADTAVVKKVVHFYEQEGDSLHVYSIEVIRTDEKIKEEDVIYQLMEKYGEVKLEYIEQDSQYSYLVGQWKTVDEAYPTWQELIKDGYDEAVVKSVNVDEVANFTLNSAFVMDNLQFDQNSWDIRNDAIDDLLEIIGIMKLFPEIKVNISAHTDTRGDDEYNNELSVKRANAVKDFLTSKGIETDRINAKGYGKNNPIDTSGTEEGNAKNRRVEFEFIK